MHADRPQILAPEGLARLLLEGFGEKAHEFADQFAERLRASGQKLPAALRYGFHFRRSEVRETLVRGESIDSVSDRLGALAEAANDPLRAVVQGVDDAWEGCLLKFTLDLIGTSATGNLGDLRGRGLL
ncbi:MAG: hypothetical protein JO117_05985 [Verrucomicrobia bacterium]|nr:hypothetical protein [Verrucomicrobiota bacterium]